MQPHPFSLKVEILNPRERTLVLPTDMQNLGAEDRMAALFPESQMPHERGTVVRVDIWDTEGKRSRSCLHLYSLRT